ncbi:MAG: guanylate kinase [Bacteroidetes bacterium CG12_big_fil_rev_8_21_14_0_65_60_17]|nr:MAG: guanylate kinase [Bacteroidetes bacterium CG12_big_fil_rev_8_21_14_0_65_60_17]
MSSKPCIIVVTSPSGAGKTTLARGLMKHYPQITFSVSATTRAPREHERDGRDYHFLTQTAFQDAIRNGRLLEYEEVYPGCFYGTLCSEVDSSSAEHPVLLDIDVHGAMNVKNRYGDAALTVFIAPPSLETLSRRLRERGTESEESLSIRMTRAEYELSLADRFDATIVNDALDAALAALVRITGQHMAACRVSA